MNGDEKSRRPLDDELIIGLYWERNERAIEETDFKYQKYLFSVAYNLLHERLDCEECVNDTYLAAWNAIPPTRPSSLKAFLTAIGRNIAIKRYHVRLKKSAIPSELTVSLSELDSVLTDGDDISDGFDADSLGRVISDFVRSLSERRQFIFVARYYASEPIDSIASDLKLSRSMINKELAAIRAALKEWLESEGYRI